MNTDDHGNAFARHIHERIKQLPDDTALSHNDFVRIAGKTARRHPFEYLGFVRWLRRTTTSTLRTAIDRLHGIKP